MNLTNEPGSPLGTIDGFSLPLAEHFPAFLADLPFALAVFKGEEHRFFYMNRRYQAVLGKSMEEVAGNSLFVCFPELKGTLIEQVHQAVYETGLARDILEHPVPCFSNGTAREGYFNLSIQPLLENGIRTGVVLTAYDVTETVTARREQQEKEHLLTQTTEKLEVALTGGELGLYDYYPQQGHVTWSNTAKDHFGLPRTSEVTFEDYLRCVHPEDRARMKARLESLVSDRTIRTYENEFRTLAAASGKLRWLRTKGTIFTDAAGNAVRLVGITQDITAVKEYQRLLVETHERLQAALTASGTGTFFWNIRTNELLWDDNLDRLFGLVPGSTAQTLEEFLRMVHPDDRAGVIARCERCAREAADFEMEFRVTWPDGSEHWLYDRGKTFLDASGKPDYMAGACVDVTFRKHTEQALRESQRRLQLTFQNTPTAIYLFDPDGRVLYCNDKGAFYLGYESAALFLQEKDLLSVQMRVKEKFEILTEDRKPFPPDHYPTARALRTGREAQAVSLFVDRGRGTEAWLLYHASPLFDESGQISGVLTSVTDITLQKISEEKIRTSEEQLRLLSEQLEQKVEERTAELRALNLELERSNEELEQFAHITSHDMKEPVRKVKLFTGRLADEYAGQLPEKAKLYLAKVDGAASRILDMIEGVLSYASLNTSRALNEEVDLAALLGQITDDLELSIKAKGATIQYGPLPNLKGSSILLHQLFYNLVGNALKFTRPDVKPLIRISGDIIEDANGGNPPQARIHIQDNGIGFHPRHAQDIFRTFYRLHANDRFEGTGMGLALCKRIIERHGGTIEAFAREGRGADFVLTVPAADNI